MTLLISLIILLTGTYIKDVRNKSQPNVLSTTTPEKIATSEARVLKVIDGDTIEIDDKKKIRYIGIDAPELHHPKKPVQCFGQEAMNKNKELVEGKIVRLEKDISETDKYGRLLRYVYIDNIFVNDYLIKNGYAATATFPPDIKYQDLFLKSQREALENNLGLWKNCPTR